MSRILDWWTRVWIQFSTSFRNLFLQTATKDKQTLKSYLIKCPTSMVHSYYSFNFHSCVFKCLIEWPSLFCLWISLLGFIIQNQQLMCLFLLFAVANIAPDFWITDHYETTVLIEAGILLSPMGYRCIQCGFNIKTLYLQYSPGNIRLMKCVSLINYTILFILSRCLNIELIFRHFCNDRRIARLWQMNT